MTALIWGRSGILRGLSLPALRSVGKEVDIRTIGSGGRGRRMPEGFSAKTGRRPLR